MPDTTTIGPGGEILDDRMGQTGGLQTLPPAGVQEISSAERAAEAEVRAMVEARCIMAYKRPRNLFQVRAKILDACARPTFAEQAIYRKPVGKKLNETTNKWEQTYAEGLSIRFAEEGYRALGNLWSSLTVQFENADKRVLRFDLMDLESNNTDSTIITVPKTVERSKLKEGQIALSSRQNSHGRVVYLVEATDDDLQVKQGAMVAKARRDAINRALPSDVKEDATAMVKKTLERRDSADPQGALKRIVDAFQMELRVLPQEIEKYLGHGLDIISPGELQSLRGVYTAVKEGDSTWAEQIKAVEEDRDGTIKGNADKATARQAEKAAAKGAEPGAGGDQKKPQTPAEKAKEKAAETGAKMAGTQESASPTGGTLPNLE